CAAAVERDGRTGLSSPGWRHSGDITQPGHRAQPKRSCLVADFARDQPMAFNGEVHRIGEHRPMIFIRRIAVVNWRSSMPWILLLDWKDVVSPVSRCSMNAYCPFRK